MSRQISEVLCELSCDRLKTLPWDDLGNPNCVSDDDLLDMVVGRGLETQLFPMQFPINEPSFWDSFSDNTPDKDVAILLFQRAGWSHEKAAYHVARYDGLVPFGKRIKSMRSMICGYKNGKVSAVVFYGYAMYFGGRFLWENVKELWNLADSFDRLFPQSIPPTGALNGFATTGSGIADKGIAIGCPAAIALVQVAFDIDFPVGRFVTLVDFLFSGGQFDFAEENRRAVGIERLEGFFGGEISGFVECVLDFLFHFHHGTLQRDFNL